jgi:hypothetical protein
MKTNRFSVLLVGVTLAWPSSLLFGQGFPQAYPQPVPQQPPYDAQAQPAQILPPEQLENLVAPIALYPDALLSQILVAATYPLEVVEVGQWLQQNRNLQGQNLVAAASQQNWDASIQALVAFPDVVSRMNSDIRWTTDLGNAFLAQQGDVMNAIQVLRSQAQANGRLASNQQQIVTTEAQGSQSVIEIQPADPEVIYVPSYDPQYVWGPSPYGYYPSLYYPEFGFSYGYGIPIGGYFGGLGWSSWGWGANWFGGGIFVNSYFFDRYHFNSYRGGRYGGGNNWAHNPDHRRGVAYSNNRVANRFEGSTRSGSRGDNRFAGGRTSSSSGGFSRGGFNGGSASGTSAGGTSRGFNGSNGGQSGGQRFSTQRDSSSFRGSNQFSANRSQAVPSQSPVAPSQGSRFGNRAPGSAVNPGGNRGTQSFQAPAQNRGSSSGNTFSGNTFSGNTRSGGFRSSPRSSTGGTQSFQAPSQSRPSQSFSGGGGLRSNPGRQSFQAPSQNRPSPSARAQSRPAPSGGGASRGNGGGGSRGNGGGNRGDNGSRARR